MFESYLFLGFLHPDYFEERVVLEVGARLGSKYLIEVIYSFFTEMMSP